MVQNVIKSVCLLFFMLLHLHNSKAQKYFYLGNIDSAKNIKQYTLHTKDLYPKIDKEIKVYNYYALNNALYLFAVFPNMKNQKDWIPIDTSNMKNILNYFDIEKIFDDAVHKYVKNQNAVIDNLKRRDIIPIINKNGVMMIPTGICTSEFFLIDPSLVKSVFPNENLVGIIDMALPTFSIKEYHEKSLLAGLRSPFSASNSYMLSLPAQASRDFLSHTSIIKGETAYHFWTLSDWSVHDGLNLQRGIERFVYIPGKGIVGGSYDFYFAFYNLLPDDLNKRLEQRINEEVMLAEELKE